MPRETVRSKKANTYLERILKVKEHQHYPPPLFVKYLLRTLLFLQQNIISTWIANTKKCY